MNFFKTSIWASLTTGLNILCGFATTKIIATKLGPEGIALTGQFSNFTILLVLFSTAACSNGVVKFLAESTDSQKRERFINNVFLLVSLTFSVVFIITVFFSTSLSVLSFHTDSYASVYLIYASILFFTCVNTITIAALNGLGKIKEMSLFSISVALINVGCVFISSYQFGIKGVVLANAFAQLLSYIIWFRRIKKNGLQFRVLKQAFEKPIILKLLKFSSMAIVSGIIAPFLQIFVRTRLMSDYGFANAGIWQATTKLSDYYLNFVYAVLGVYFLPKLSSINDKRLIRNEIVVGNIRVVPSVILLAVIIWLLRDTIIRVAFTAEFADMVYLLKWQLIGDVIKVSSFILSYLLIAKALFKAYIIIEIFFAVLYIFLSIFLIDKYGMLGSVYAFALNYLLYFITLIFVLHDYLFIK